MSTRNCSRYSTHSVWPYTYERAHAKNVINYDKTKLKDRTDNRVGESEQIDTERRVTNVEDLRRHLCDGQWRVSIAVGTEGLY